MAVTEYKTETGETLCQVYVNVRSLTNSKLRTQKRVGRFKSLREAEREEMRLLRECERSLLEKEAQGSSWGAVVEAFENYSPPKEMETLSPLVKRDYVAAARKHTSMWWTRPAAALLKSDFRELFVQLRSTGISFSHLKKMKLICHRIYSFGQEHGLIKGVGFSPLQGLALGRDQEKKPEILTLSEIRTLLASAKELQHPWYPVWALALLTGMRNGELYALQWSDVDRENRTLTVSKSYNGRLKCIKSTKAGYWRSVPISSELESLLKDLAASAGTRTFVLPRNYKWTLGMQARKLRHFCLGLQIPSVRFHDLRACFATQLIRNGVPPIQIQKICGWRDLKTMQRYIRMAGIEIEGATEKLKILPERALPEMAAKLFQADSEHAQK